ncbi:MAG: hypothetical protein JWO98_671 [Frankiales bacterium]|nr:hypothetical protein [Frankiales bacterium]
MTTAAAICFAIALAAELRGICIVVEEGKRTAAILRRWRGANPAGHQGGSLAQLEALNGVLTELLEGQANRRRAVQLLVAGVMVGALGNFLSLSW